MHLSGEGGFQGVRQLGRSPKDLSDFYQVQDLYGGQEEQDP